MLRHLRFDEIPVSFRTPDELAVIHGADSLTDFARTIPTGGSVIDAGAGDSLFGHSVAKMRPDVSWSNLDYSYHNSGALAVLQQCAPPNLQLIAGDATKMHDSFVPESADLITSYWMLPHFSEDNRRLALQGMYRTLRIGGRLSIAPPLNTDGTTKGFFSLLNNPYGTLQFTKTEHTAADTRQLEQLISQMRQPKIVERYQLASQHAQHKVMGTNRPQIPIDTKGTHLTYDKKLGTYTSTAALPRFADLRIAARTWLYFALGTSD